MTLKLRIDKHVDSDGGPPPRAFATIYAVDPRSGERRRDLPPRRELVPISTNGAEVQSLSVSEGRYMVEVAMPSGEILSDWIDVPSSGEADLTLKAEESPHEWLSWQSLVGNVGAGAAVSAPKRRRSGKFRSVAAAAPPSDLLGGTATEVREATGAFPVPVAPPSLAYLTTPLPGLLPGTVPDVWTALAAVPNDAPAFAQSLNSGLPVKEIPLFMQDQDFAIYRVAHGTWSIGGATPLQSTLPRDYIAVPINNGVELVSLPLPWVVIDTGREAAVELVVRPPARPYDFATALTVRDERLGVLLGYLSSGALGAAREITDTARDLLFGKVLNPLAAAAGAYTLVGTATDNAEHDWHGWVANLCNWFPNIPDGAVLLAQLHLRLRRTPDDLPEAQRWLKEAYRRGLPFYSLGMRWLLDGLEKLAQFDPELDQMRRAVQLVARSIHPQSAFTILRLGPA